MEFSEIFKENNFSTAIEESLNDNLSQFLLRDDGQEDLIFALWTPSYGNKRVTAIINEIVFPNENDRNVHGNVSYNYQYLLKVCRLALKKGKGVALLHSHLGPGWQNMSYDDIATEQKTFVNAFSTTNLPLVGLTLGTDGYWSSRIWYYNKRNKITKKWAVSVRVIGLKFKIYFNDKLLPPQKSNNKTIRTKNVWGEKANKDITRLKIGIVGLGSVGSVVVEMLARMGITKFALIDYDFVEEHNLDRLCGVYKKDIGKRKIDVIKNHIKKSSTADKVDIEICKLSLIKKKAYMSALDCDIIFCCVDKPLGRYLLNHIAYSHLIPVINGGILIEFDDERNLNFADWTVHTITPGRPCLKCLNAYQTSDVELERQGKLEDPNYMINLPDNHRLKSKQNISPFSFNLASFEVIHFMALVADIVEPEYYGEQKYRFKHGHLSKNNDIKYETKCDFSNNIGVADSIFELYDA